MLHLELSIFRLPIYHFITFSFFFVQSLSDQRGTILFFFGYLEMVTWHGHGLGELRSLSAMVCWCLCSITHPCAPANHGEHFGNKSQTEVPGHCFPVLGTRTSNFISVHSHLDHPLMNSGAKPIPRSLSRALAQHRMN